jgi:predicted enzyme related to lactoylglutathione lyase
VIAAGGSDVGKIVTAEIDHAGKARIAYVTDPEGNVIELQHWFR